MAKRKRPSPPPGPAASPAPADGWIYGLHAVRAALANPRRRCRRLLVTEENAAVLAPPAGAPAPEIVAREELDRRLGPGAVHQGVAGRFDPPAAVALADAVAGLAPGEPALVLVLDQVTDPHNVGAVLRSAAAFGATAVVVQDRHSPPLSGVVLKAASGAAEIVPLVRVINLARALDELKDAGFWCIGLDAAGPDALAEVPLDGRVALVLGAEGAGLRRLTRERCDRLARIDIAPAMDSLNVSASAAVALYEWRRRT